MKNADENELRSIASEPDEIHMYNVNDFSFMLDIVDDLTVNLCNSVKGKCHKKNWPFDIQFEAELDSKCYRPLILMRRVLRECRWVKG